MGLRDMLEDIVKAIGNMRTKAKQVRYIDGRIFICDDSLGNIVANLKSTSERSLERDNYLNVLKRHLSQMHYYLIEDGNVLSGFLLDNCPTYRVDLPKSSGSLISGYNYLPHGDSKITRNTGIALFKRGKYVAEFTNNSVKHVISVRAFDRFVRNYRQNKEISLRSCLFEMYRCVTKAVVRNEDAKKLEKKLRRLFTRDKKGNRRPLLGFGRTWYLYFKGDPGWIFVRHNDEIVYCQPVY